MGQFPSHFNCSLLKIFLLVKFFTGKIYTKFGAGNFCFWGI